MLKVITRDQLVMLSLNEKTVPVILLMLKDDLVMFGLPHDLALNFAGQILSDVKTLDQIIKDKSMPAYIGMFQHKNNNNDLVWNWRFILDQDTLIDATKTNTPLFHCRYFLNKAVKIQTEIIQNEVESTDGKTLH